MEFINCLRKFNAKERFILLENVLLERPKSGADTYDNFILSESFIKKLKEIIPDLNIPNPPSFIAIDYHLNWLYAALTLAFDDRYKNISNFKDFTIEKIETKTSHSSKDPSKDHTYATVEGNQEDIDMVLCWQYNNQYKLILIEAKATTAWDIKQLESKAERLGLIFGIEEKPTRKSMNFNNLYVFFILISPSNPNKKPIFKERPKWLPKWMLKDEKEMLWVPLNINQEEIWMVTRCKDGKPNKDGKFWTLKKR